MPEVGWSARAQFSAPAARSSNNPVHRCQGFAALVEHPGTCVSDRRSYVHGSQLSLLDPESPGVDQSAVEATPPEQLTSLHTKCLPTAMLNTAASLSSGREVSQPEIRTSRSWQGCCSGDPCPFQTVEGRIERPKLSLSRSHEKVL